MALIGSFITMDCENRTVNEIFTWIQFSDKNQFEDEKGLKILK